MIYVIVYHSIGYDSLTSQVKRYGMRNNSTHIIYKTLTPQDLYDTMLLDFNRYQEVKKHYVKTERGLITEDCDYTDDWDKAKKLRRVDDFRQTIAQGGTVIAAFDGERVAGFGCVGGKKLGTQGQYLQLKYLHVCYEYRRCGIGKRLLAMCADAARSAGAKKLYISASSAYETQLFYRAAGCTEAEEPIQYLCDKEPFDIQTELRLT